MNEPQNNNQSLLVKNNIFTRIRKYSKNKYIRCIGIYLVSTIATLVLADILITKIPGSEISLNADHAIGLIKSALFFLLPAPLLISLLILWKEDDANPSARYVGSTVGLIGIETLLFISAVQLSFSEPDAFDGWVVMGLFMFLIPIWPISYLIGYVSGKVVMRGSNLVAKRNILLFIFIVLGLIIGLGYAIPKFKSVTPDPTGIMINSGLVNKKAFFTTDYSIESIENKACTGDNIYSVLISQNKNKKYSDGETLINYLTNDGVMHGVSTRIEPGALYYNNISLDIDNDGKCEYLGSNAYGVRLYGFSGLKLWEYNGPLSVGHQFSDGRSRFDYISLDAMDLNNDGRLEIIITGDDNDFMHVLDQNGELISQLIGKFGQHYFYDIDSDGQVELVYWENIMDFDSNSKLVREVRDLVILDSQLKEIRRLDLKYLKLNYYSKFKGITREAGHDFAQFESDFSDIKLRNDMRKVMVNMTTGEAQEEKIPKLITKKMDELHSLNIAFTPGHIYRVEYSYPEYGGYESRRRTLLRIYNPSDVLIYEELLYTANELMSVSESDGSESLLLATHKEKDTVWKYSINQKL